MSEENPEIKCLIEDCNKEQRWKGLCSACYGQAKQLIDAGETSWEQLAELGLAIIPDKPFVAAFKKKMAARKPIVDIQVH